MFDFDLINACDRQRFIERFHHIRRSHGCTELPRDDVAREIIQHGRELVPALVDDPEVREVRSPHFMNTRGGVLEGV